MHGGVDYLKGKRVRVRNKNNKTSKWVEQNSAWDVVMNLTSMSPITQTPIQFSVSASDGRLFFAQLSSDNEQK